MLAKQLFSVSRYQWYGMAAKAIVESAVKADKQLVMRLRHQFEGLSMMKIKEALELSDNNYDNAVKYIQQSHAGINQKKMERQLNDGLVAIVSRRGIGTSIFNLRCETDFVAQTDLFKELAVNVASTALLYHGSNTIMSTSSSSSLGSSHLPASKYTHDDDRVMSKLMESPMVNLKGENGGQLSNQLSSVSVQQSVLDGISKLGENIRVQSGFVVPSPPAVSQLDTVWEHVGFAVHQATARPDQVSSDDSMEVLLGKSGCIFQLEGQQCQKPSAEVLSQVSQKLCNHIIGMRPTKISGYGDDALYHQQFIFGSEGETVSYYLQSLIPTDQSNDASIEIKQFCLVNNGSDPVFAQLK
ncbi:hypothetical protein MIR68_006446 [Amoeboaphelidium protococcarum]|nr:hypothetical protein MIR68_006446 [Amoeboaphelidium protococcarum]